MSSDDDDLPMWVRSADKPTAPVRPDLKADSEEEEELNFKRKPKQSLKNAGAALMMKAWRRHACDLHACQQGRSFCRKRVRAIRGRSRNRRLSKASFKTARQGQTLCSSSRLEARKEAQQPAPTPLCPREILPSCCLTSLPR